MPIVPITKTMTPILVFRETADKLDCEELYLGMVRRVGTQDVDIEVLPGVTNLDGSWTTYASLRVPRSPVKLGSLFSDRYTECKVIVRYTHGASGLDPNEKLTRQEFIMQTLDIWERLYTGTQYHHKKQSDTETQITTAMEVLKSTYSFQELMPPGLNMETFKAMFATDQENGDGTLA
jgi:hypothetical protein